MVGSGHDDYSGLWGHGAQDLRRDHRRLAVRPLRGPRDRPPRPRHRVQLLNVLLAHPGQDEAAQEAEAGGGCPAAPKTASQTSRPWSRGSH